MYNSFFAVFFYDVLFRSFHVRQIQSVTHFREATAKARSKEKLAQRQQRQEKDRTLTSASRSNETLVQKSLRNRTNRLE